MKRAALILLLCTMTGIASAETKAAAKKEASQKEASQEKENYLKKADKQVQEWNSKIQSLEDRSQDSGTKTRKELDEKISAVRRALDAAREKLEKLRGSSESAWRSLRDGLDRTFDDIKNHYQKAASAVPSTKKR